MILYYKIFYVFLKSHFIFSTPVHLCSHMKPLHKSNLLKQINNNIETALIIFSHLSFPDKLDYEKLNQLDEFNILKS